MDYSPAASHILLLPSNLNSDTDVSTNTSLATLKNQVHLRVQIRTDHIPTTTGAVPSPATILLQLATHHHQHHNRQHMLRNQYQTHIKLRRVPVPVRWGVISLWVHL
jgi:hypothetical protein